MNKHITALKTLVEAADQSEIECLATIHQQCFHDLVPAAREALERVAQSADWQSAYESMLKKFEDEQRQQIALYGRLAQFQRNETHWRARAETAEALAVWQETKIKDLEETHACAIFWLLRAYKSGHRHGWEPGPSSQETMDGLFTWLCNAEFVPTEQATPTTVPEIIAVLRNRQ